jgi:hypothetical protein
MLWMRVWKYLAEGLQGAPGQQHAVGLLHDLIQKIKHFQTFSNKSESQTVK